MLKFFKSVFNILKTNWPMKLISLLLAISIWFAIYATTTTSQEYYIDLDLQTGLPPNYKIDMDALNNTVSEIKVNIWGNRDFLQQEITGTTFHAKILYINSDGKLLVKDGIGIYEVIVEPKIKLPEDQVNYNYEPKEVQLALIDVEANTIISKKIRVNLENVSITPKEGYIIKSIRTEPPEITIQGKRKSLKRIDYIFTEPLDIDGIYKNTKYKTGLIFLDSNIDVDILNPVDKTVTISVEVEEAKKTKEFFDISIDYINIDESLTITNREDLKLDSLMVTGSSTLISEIKSSDIKPYIDLKGMSETGTYPKDIKLDFSNDININQDELDIFYSPQTIYINLIYSYEESIQDLGKNLFSLSNTSNYYERLNPFDDRAGVISGEDENDNNTDN